jgi:hypothetical protein
MKRRLEQDKTQSIKKSSLNETESKATSSKPIMAMTLRKRPASKLKPQSRKPSLLEELPLSPTKSINDSLQDKASVDEAKPNKKKRSIEQPSKESLPQKKKRERSNSHSTIQSSPSNTAIPDSTRKQPTLKSRKRNATTETYHHQAPSAIASTSNYAYYNNPATTGYSHYVEDQYLQNASINHPRYNSHQPTSGMQQETISPVVSRHNSLTMMEFNQMNDNLVIPSQFDITHSPFGERIFYNSLEPFDQPMVSLIPAVRTPIGDRNSLINTPSPVSQSYDTTLDIFNAIIIQQNQQDSSDNTSKFYI